MRRISHSATRRNESRICVSVTQFLSMVLEIDESMIQPSSNRLERLRPRQGFNQPSEALCKVHCDRGGVANAAGEFLVHSSSFSVGVVAVPTVADAGGVASLSGESPALCTTCDHRLDDAAIRACSVRDCPHAQREAA